MSGLREIMVDESALATTTCFYGGMTFFLFTYLIYTGFCFAGVACLLWLTMCFSPCLVPLALLGGGGGTVIHLPANIYY